MIIVIDSNIVFAALLKDSITRRILVNPLLRFYAPDAMLTEIHKHKNMLVSKSGLSGSDFELLLQLITEKIEVIGKESYKTYLKDAKKLLGDEHLGDVPFLALAMAVENDGIWSEDKDFEKQNLVKVWKTTDIAKYLKLIHEWD
jgi:predicted nucleic acid-binding protein